MIEMRICCLTLVLHVLVLWTVDVQALLHDALPEMSPLEQDVRAIVSRLLAPGGPTSGDGPESEEFWRRVVPREVRVALAACHESYSQMYSHRLRLLRLLTRLAGCMRTVTVNRRTRCKHAPFLTVVMAGRNDGYGGGGFAHRLRLSGTTVPIHTAA